MKNILKTKPNFEDMTLFTIVKTIMQEESYAEATIEVGS